MKIVLVILLLVVSTPLYAQDTLQRKKTTWQLELYAAPELPYSSQPLYDGFGYTPSYRIGFNAGILIQKNITKKLSVNLNFMFIEERLRYTSLYQYPVLNDLILSQRQSIEVPLKFKFYIVQNKRNQWFIDAGAGPKFRVRNQECVYTTFPAKQLEIEYSEFKFKPKPELNFLLGFGADVSLNAKWHITIEPMLRKTFVSDYQHATALHFNATIGIGRNL